MPFPSPVWNISPALSSLVGHAPSLQHSHSLSPLSSVSRIFDRIRPKTHAWPAWVWEIRPNLRYDRNLCSARSEIRPDLLSGYPRSPDLAGSHQRPKIWHSRTQIRSRIDRHSRTQFRLETHPYCRRSLTSSSPVGSIGRASTGLVEVVDDWCVGFPAVFGFNRNEKGIFVLCIYLFIYLTIFALNWCGASYKAPHQFENLLVSFSLCL
jgi:hypothetical protein